MFARAFVAAVLIASCSRPTEGTSPPAPDGAIHLGPTVEADIGLRTELARRARLAPTIALLGEIAADPDRSAVVTTPVPGTLASIAFKEGDRVKRGDVIAQVTVTEVTKIQTARRVALARAAAARADAKRLKDLVDKSLRPEQVLLDAEAAAASAEAEARGLGDQLGILGAGASSSALPLLSPRDGVVVTRNAVVGARCEVTDNLVTIADLSSALFVAHAFEQDLPRVRVGAKATMVIDALSAELTGAIEGVADKLDPISRSTDVRIRVADPRIKIGMFGVAWISTDGAATAEVVTVPRSAVTEIAGRKVVFVRSNNAFIMRHVVLGAADRERVAIASGIAEGEEIAVEGVFSLKSIVLRTTLSEG